MTQQDDRTWVVPTTGTPVVGTDRLRVSDAERQAYAHVVETAMGHGMLTFAEGEERLAAVYGARYRGELDPLVADLPLHRPAGGGAPGHGPDPCPMCGGPAPDPWHTLLIAARTLLLRYRVAAAIIAAVLLVGVVGVAAIAAVAFHGGPFPGPGDGGGFGGGFGDGFGHH